MSLNHEGSTPRQMVSALAIASSENPLAAPADAARERMFVEANINPRTGLATDYLNHFNEAIMLLEMIPDMPECAEDFIEWRPRTYHEHFRASHLKAQNIIIQAYDEADPLYRAQFDRAVGAMTSILLAVNDAMRNTNTDKRIILARHGADWMKPFLLLADNLIHGNPETADIGRIMEK